MHLEANVVDPNGWETIVQVSPEAQAFVLLLQSSWQDWKGKVHAKVQNDKSRRRWAIVAREPF